METTQSSLHIQQRNGVEFRTMVPEGYEVRLFQGNFYAVRSDGPALYLAADGRTWKEFKFDAEDLIRENDRHKPSIKDEVKVMSITERIKAVKARGKELLGKYRNWIIVYVIGAVMGMWIYGPLLTALNTR